MNRMMSGTPASGKAKVGPTLQTRLQPRRYQDRSKYPDSIPGTWREGVMRCRARNALDCVMRENCDCPTYQQELDTPESLTKIEDKIKAGAIAEIKAEQEVFDQKIMSPAMQALEELAMSSEDQAKDLLDKREDFVREDRITKPIKDGFAVDKDGNVRMVREGKYVEAK